MLIHQGCTDGRQIEKLMRTELESSPVDSIDYAAIVDPDTLEPIETIASEVVGIIAARVGTTRLIDNATFALH
jgi:pantoate--beta-alanine ligase